MLLPIVPTSRTSSGRWRAKAMMIRALTNGVQVMRERIGKST
jgi:hypothetical protein